MQTGCKGKQDDGVLSWIVCDAWIFVNQNGCMLGYECGVMSCLQYPEDSDVYKDQICAYKDVGRQDDGVLCSGHLDAGYLCSNGCMEDMGRQDDDVLSPISRIQVIRMQICAWRMWGDKTMVFWLRTSGCRIFMFKWMHGGYGETG